MAGAHRSPTSLRLSEGSRWLLGVAGVAFVGGGITLFVNPPSQKQFAPQCAESSCVQDVAQSSDVLSTALVGGGAVLLLVGVNGRQLTGIKVAGAEATMATEAKDADARATLAADVAAEAEEPVAAGEEPEDLAPAEGTASVISIGGTELVRVEPSQVPSRVLTDLAAAGVGVRASADLDWGARLLGRGNHPWYVRLRNGNVYKLSYGGQRDTEATVTKIN